MLRDWLLAFPLVTLPAFAAPVAPDMPTRAAVRAIEMLEHDWLDHVSDRATLERVLADDFVHVVPQGEFLSREQHIAWAVAHPRRGDRRASFETLRVRVYGRTAIATGIVINTGAGGADAQRSIFTDVFVLRNGTWQAVNAQENAVSK